MALRIQRCVLALAVACAALRGGAACGQTGPESQLQPLVLVPPPPLPYLLDSLEWLTADAEIVARGRVVDVSKAMTSMQQKTVTLDVAEILKGAKAERLQFNVRIMTEDSRLEQWRESKEEVLCFLRRGPLGSQYGDAKPGDKELKGQYYAGTHGNSHRMSVIALGRPQAVLDKVQGDARYSREFRSHPCCFTMDLRLPATADEVLKAVRAAAHFGRGRGPTRWYSLHLPVDNFAANEFDFLTVPCDERLEALARRLIESPGDFVTNVKYDVANRLRLEGIKALRLFKSEKNLAYLRAASGHVDPKDRHAAAAGLDGLLPGPARVKASPARLTDLASVPEVHFQQPLAKTMSIDEAQLWTACTIDVIHFLNQKKTDGFMEALTQKRSDLAGLPFMMGDACRMSQDAAGNFVASLANLHKAEDLMVAELTRWNAESTSRRRRELMSFYGKVGAGRADVSSQVAALMQVLGHEDGGTRLGLVEFLDGIAHADAARALARLAIFSAEADIRTAALRALKMRRDGDYTDVLLTGLTYPWPAVAERSCEAIVQLGRSDLMPHLIDLLEGPDPRAPRQLDRDGKKTTVVRELVRINHHHNCLLCHAPAAADLEVARTHKANAYQDALRADDEFRKTLFDKEDQSKARSEAVVAKAVKMQEVVDRAKHLLENASIMAQVPVPGESLEAYYRPSNPDILVRFDVTYLRQDFSMKLRVADAAPWPEMQRYDFLVRTRELSEQEAAQHQELLRSSGSPYQRLALSALRLLSGRDAGTTAAAWRKMLRL